jgi:chemotaxis-related protein WspD
VAKKRSPNKRHNDCWNKIGVWSTVSEKCERLSQVVHCRNCDVFSQAGREVLERKPPGGYVTQWRSEIAHQVEKTDTSLTGVMTFRIGKEWFAISAKSLQEVAELRTIHRVPHNANPYIAGVVNIGGEVDICYSLGSLLGLEKQKKRNHTYQRLMVVNYQGNRYIFPVSEVSGMTRFGKADIVSIPSTLSSEKSSLVECMVLLEKSHITVLNVDQICESLRGLAV